jgi:hypothetical protein
MLRSSRTRLALLASATLAASASLAFAADLAGVRSGGAGSANAAISSCDPDGLPVSFTTSAGAVTAVTVSGIADPACEDGRLSLTLTDAAGAGIAGGGPQLVPVDADSTDDSLTVAVTPQPAAETVAGIRLVVVGP